MNTVLMYIVKSEAEIPQQMLPNTAYYVFGKEVRIIDQMGQVSIFTLPPKEEPFDKEGFENRLHMCKPENMEMLPEEVLNKSITELWVSMNIKRSLFRMGCKTIKDIIQEGQVAEIDKNSYEEVSKCIQVLVALYLPKDIICKE